MAVYEASLLRYLTGRFQFLLRFISGLFVYKEEHDSAAVGGQHGYSGG